MGAAPKAFITYSHNDKAERKELRTRLGVMESNGEIELWDDNEILPGDEWYTDIAHNLANSDILLYLVSAASLASKNCNKELADALSTDTRVIPIILEACDWKNHKLSRFEVLPDKGRPINSWKPASEGWQNVVDGIRKVLGTVHTQTTDRNQKGALCEWVFQQGNFLIMLRQFEKAIKAYSHAIELDSHFAAAYYNRGTAYGINGEHALAIEDFTNAIGLKPDHAEAYDNRGLTFANKGDLGRAILDYTKAIKLKPIHANAYYNRGRAYSEMGDSERAILDYTKVVEINPNNAKAYYYRGVANECEGDIECAIADFVKAIELKPEYAIAYINRGSTYKKKGDIERAITANTAVIETNPGFAAIAYINRGAAYGEKGDFDRAITDFTKATNLTSDVALAAIAYSNRGSAYQRKGLADRAIEDHEKAIEINDDYSGAYYNRGVAYGVKGEYDYAIEDYTKVIELNPNDAKAYNNRGVAYWEKRIIDQAITDYTKAIRLNQDFAESYYNRGEAWLHLQEWEKAKADLVKAKKLGVDIVAAFRNDYRNVAAFERANQVKLPEDIAALVRQGFRNRYPRKEKVLTADGRSLNSPEDYTLVKRLRDAGTPLEQYIKTQPFFGIKTTPTEVFVVDGKTRDKLIAEHSSSEDILKPILHGRNIRRWQVEPPEQWLIFSYRGIEINAYPAIRNYLEKHKDSLSKRKGRGGWYELRASVEEIKRYSGPKLVCPNLYNTQTFAVETDGYFCGSTCYIIPTDETWLCGLLNTRTVEWLYAQISQQLGPGELQARSGFIKQIPVPDLNATQKDVIRKIVEYLIYLQNQPTTNSKDLTHANDFVMLKYFERIINGLVYEYYMPDVLQGGNRDLFKHLMAEQLPEMKEIQSDKMRLFRSLFERLNHREHPVQVNLFFQDGLRPIRIIEDKW